MIMDLEESTVSLLALRVLAQGPIIMGLFCLPLSSSMCLVRLCTRLCGAAVGLYDWDVRARIWRFRILLSIDLMDSPNINTEFDLAIACIYIVT